MIRLIRRKLIIPQGDTGTFTIPMQGTMTENDKAIISIYDELTHTVVLEKEMTQNENTLSYTFSSEDTVNIEPDESEYGGRYRWDITIQREPIRDENDNIIGYSDIDSYYAAFTLPPCIIKRVTRNVL